eukprot:359802-Chlamydomonas_euryale.AAC.2
MHADVWGAAAIPSPAAWHCGHARPTPCSTCPLVSPDNALVLVLRQVRLESRRDRCALTTCPPPFEKQGFACILWVCPARSAPFFPAKNLLSYQDL